MFSIRKLGAIGRTYRHLNRYQRILRVLFKYGFNDLVDRLHIDQYLESGLQMINRKPREQIARLGRPERMRLVFEELGPTFIKLGQLLSTRPDLIPAEYLDELARLQDEVPPFSLAEVHAIFREELGRSPDDLDAEIDEAAQQRGRCGRDQSCACAVVSARRGDRCHRMFGRAHRGGTIRASSATNSGPRWWSRCSGRISRTSSPLTWRSSPTLPA